MNWEPIPDHDHEIKDVNSTISGSLLHLTWFWPKEIDFVYLYKANADNFLSIEELDERQLKLYTRSEYKANQGYIASLEAIGKFGYQILPCQRRDGKLHVFKQDNEDNLIFITGAKAKIYFSIAYKNKLFEARKKVKMAIITELPLDKQLLCFVKKRDAVPESVEDGTWYPFVRDFPAGKTQLPEMELAKNEYLRIFFTQGKKTAETFELIPE